MIQNIIRFAIERRWLVVACTIAFVAWGIYQYRQLPIDAVPDITNVQVQINARAPGYSPLEAESRVTFPMETALGGLPKLKSFRSISKYGLSQVTAVFEDGTDIYFARQLVNERLQTIRTVYGSRYTIAFGCQNIGDGCANSRIIVDDQNRSVRHGDPPLRV